MFMESLRHIKACGGSVRPHGRGHSGCSQRQSVPTDEFFKGQGMILILR